MAAPVSITDPDMHRVQEVTQSECEWKPGDKDLLGSSDLPTEERRHSLWDEKERHVA
jgi:hypothetical protein